MTFTKRTLSLFLVPAMLFGLAACSKAPSPQPAEATTAATEPQTTVSPTDSLFESMTLEEKVGQLFYMCYPDDSFAETIKNYHLGGLVLFGAHFEDKTADQIRQQIKAYQQSAEKVGLLIGVDEEGGDVVRVSSNPNVRSEAFWSPKVTYQDGGWDAVTAAETEKADLLLSLGVNVNNAPVCDVTSNEESFIYSRSFSGDVNDVCTYVTKTVDICREKKLGTVLKHFPGYGDNTDTHEDMAYDSKPYSDFQQTDFLPFGGTDGFHHFCGSHIIWILGQINSSTTAFCQQPQEFCQISHINHATLIPNSRKKQGSSPGTICASAGRVHLRASWWPLPTYLPKTTSSPDFCVTAPMWRRAVFWSFCSSAFCWPGGLSVRWSWHGRGSGSLWPTLCAA